MVASLPGFSDPSVVGAATDSVTNSIESISFFIYFIYLCSKKLPYNRLKTEICQPTSCMLVVLGSTACTRSYLKLRQSSATKSQTLIVPGLLARVLLGRLDSGM